MAQRTAKWWRFWKNREDGSMTVYGIYLFMLVLLAGGVAIDVSSVNLAKRKLQVTADAVAHAALYNREKNSSEYAIAQALEIAEAWMPFSKYGSVVTAEDIEFGSWDHDTATFTANASSKSAVRVLAHLDRDHGNALPAILLRLTDSDNLFDVRAGAIFTTFIPNCLREGFVAEGIVDMQSNNGFSAGFCVHSNSHVALNNNNTFEPGTVVSMPNLEDIELDRNGYEKNEGLEAALREGAYRMRTLNNTDTIIAGLLAADPEYTPDYISGTAVITLVNRNLTEADFVPGRIHYVSCRGGGSVTITTTLPLQDVVLVTDCKVKFSQGATVENSIIATTSTDSRSITGPSGVNIGKDDGCADGGGTSLISKGGMSFAADLALYGGRIVSEGDISFAAKADGIQGASIIAGGQVDGTSNSNMGFCGQGMEASYEAEYFRLAL